MEDVGEFGGEIRVYDYIPKLVGGAFSGALTGVFALAGAFTGAVSGALAGRASDSGLLRGAGLGAVAGAVLSVEVLEASRAYWCSQHPDSPTASSMADFMEELLQGRFVDDQVPPPALAGYFWQASIANVIYDDIYDVYGDVAPRGLSGDSLKELPYHLILDVERATHNICCAICLQDFEVGETARSLPHCSHTFHLKCVDRWLQSHGSCPVCRRHV
ncbi:hypothetical protein vseg_003045 [Gypsophila vaccaria]